MLKKPITFGSLFTGVGGADLGMESIGWHPRWMCEIDTNCRKVLEHHWPNVFIHEDVTLLNGKLLDPVDVLWMSPPCQDVSVAGKRAGINGKNSGLFFDAIRVVKEILDAGNGPKAIIMEQVPGILSSRGGEDWATVIETVADLGALAIEWRVIDGRFTGPPQRRRRVAFVAIFDSRAANRPQILTDSQSSGRNLASGSETASEFPTGTRGGVAGDCVSALTANMAGAGGGVDDNTAQAGHPIVFPEMSPPLQARDWRGVVSNDHKPLVFHLTQDPITGFVSPSLSSGNTATGTIGLQDKNLVRRLTPLECERLQGFPDGHTAPAGADYIRYKQCGNAVMSPWAAWVARRVEKTLESSD